MSSVDNSSLYLAWIQPSVWDRHFELYSAKSLLGTLQFDANNAATGEWTGSTIRKSRPGDASSLPETPTPWTGSLVLASPATKCWVFKTEGILKSRMTIREVGSDAELAVFRSKRFREDAWVEFVSGRRFHWKSTNSWKPERGFYNDRNEMLFAMRRKFWDLMKIQSDVKVKAICRDMDELRLLLILAGYLSVREGLSGYP